MKVTRATLDTLLLNNVLDLRFVRRIPKQGQPLTRRMLCTKAYNLLNSLNGKIVLNYRAPSKQKQFNESVNNACIVWDIIMQDYRIVSADSVDVLRTIPADDSFWNFFNKEIYTLTTEQKVQYMNS